MTKEPFRLDGDVAVVTGGARGLGRAISEVFAVQGATVVIVDILGDLAEQTAGEIRDAGGVAEARTLDVTDEAMIEAAFAGIVKAHGRLDILVNNAGIGLRKPAVSIPREGWDKVIEVNLTAVFLCARIAGRHMIAGGGGRIVNIASIHGPYRRPLSQHLVHDGEGRRGEHDTGVGGGMGRGRRARERHRANLRQDRVDGTDSAGMA